MDNRKGEAVAEDGSNGPRPRHRRMERARVCPTSRFTQGDPTGSSRYHWKRLSRTRACGVRQRPGTRIPTNACTIAVPFGRGSERESSSRTWSKRMERKDIELGDVIHGVRRRARSGVVVGVRLTADEADRLEQLA